MASSRVVAAFLIAVALASACSAGPDRSEVTAEQSADCGPDVIQLFAAGDPAVVALYNADDAEYGRLWLARVRCLAEAGDAESQLKMGIAYRDGSDGPPHDYAVAAGLVPPCRRSGPSYGPVQPGTILRGWTWRPPGPCLGAHVV